MKEIIFDSDDLQDLDKIAEKLFMAEDAEHDPTSIYYKRQLERPRISWLRIFLHVSIPVLGSVAIALILIQLNLPVMPAAIASCSLLLLYALLSLKKMLICCVRIYQRYASDSIRMKCRFEPSCSQYMILAIEKYGSLKGLRHGIKRLKRCKIGNGGYDYP